MSDGAVDQCSANGAAWSAMTVFTYTTFACPASNPERYLIDLGSIFRSQAE